MCLSNFTDRNSFAETVCTPFWNLIVIGKISLDFVAKTLTKNLHFVARLPMNYYKRILQAWIVSCLSIPVLDALYKARKLSLVSTILWKKRKIDISHWSGHLLWFLRAKIWGIDEVRRLLEIVYNLFLELWMSGVYFFDVFLVSFATVSVLGISRGTSNP